MPTHDIIDNRNQKLVDHIRQTLPGSQAAKFAVGYFFLSGLEAVADVLNNVQELRLLIGNTSSRQTIEQIAEGYRRLEQVGEVIEEDAFAQRRERQRRAEETRQIIGQTVGVMDQTDQAEELVSILVRLIEEDRLKVRVYTRGRLHAKAYIFDYAPIFDAVGNPIPRPEKGIAVVGSSNLSLSGISHNTELNVIVYGNDNHAALTQWFKTLWDEAEPFDDHLMEELRQSWSLAQVTPYEIYLKTLYELVSEQIEETGEGTVIWQSEIMAALADFQRQAVRRAVQMIRQYGGCFVADVVGLGKSYIGAAIVKQFERSEHARPLIVCPAPLVEMWEHYNEAYQLNARVLSMGLLRTRDDQPHLLLDEAKYRDRDFVLVDESHNFRNPDTQRYKVLQEYLQTGGRRCVLLTATPRNRTAWDVYNQLRLFHIDDITTLPIDPPYLRQYFKLIDQGKRDLPRLLANVLVRRTRADILRWYGFDEETHQTVDPNDFEPYRRGERRAYVMVAGKAQFFPRRRLKTIEYSIESTYNGLYSRLKNYLGTGEPSVVPHTPGLANGRHLTYARYGLGRYVLPNKHKLGPYNELQRAGINLRGLMRISLFKRFESSVYAFRCTLQRMLSSHRTFRMALDSGIVPAGEEAQTILYESDQYEEQDLLDALTEVSGRYRIEDFNSEALRNDIRNDIVILEKMLQLIEPITPDQDDKLQILQTWLNDGVEGQNRLADQKCLIFTQYADTATYLHNQLNPADDPHIEVIYSQGKNKAQIVGRFSPKSNPEHRPALAATEIDLLIATDVLSEGLNLQDCNQIINYDLHWNPVRLIQRFGRVDRIGSVHDEIFGFNFLPETELEKTLGLQERLRLRIQEIHNTIGEDAAILDPNEQLNEEAFYAIYRDGSVDRFEGAGDEDELVNLNEAEQIIRQLRNNEPDTFLRIRHLRDGIRCGRHLPSYQNGAIVMCRAGNFKQLYLLNEQGEIVSQDIPFILNLLKCHPDTPATVLPSGHNQRIMGLKQQFVATVEARRAEQSHTATLSRAQRYLQLQLRLLLAEVDDESIKTKVTVFEAAFTAPLNAAIRTEINALHRNRVEGLALLDVLERIYLNHSLGDVSHKRHTLNHEDDLALIVCSEGLE